ncbi:MAG: response regulator transcription factor [Mediterraneibacter gnavus]
MKTCRSQSDIPVLMLTANDLEMNEVIGFELGANDYVTKPFHLAVLRARIQNLLRMTAKEDKSVYEDARFRFDFAKLYYQKDGQTVVLSNTEQKLLKLLVDNQKTTLSRQMLIDRVWTDGAEYVDENALSVAISRLRNKLEDTLSRPMFIQNVYGIGYVWRTGKGEDMAWISRKTYEHLEEMLDVAIAEEFEESAYDESEMSRLETKWKRF